MLRDARSAQSASEVNVESCRKVGRKQNVAVCVLILSKTLRLEREMNGCVEAKSRLGYFDPCHLHVLTG